MNVMTTWALLLGLLCLGVFVGGIVVIVILVATRKSRSGQASFSCPDCGRQVMQFAESCPHCGRVLLEPPE
jgi:predicted RNA-binding Zn-ribbon protein involved in translation (DUF1610 family)